MSTILDELLTCLDAWEPQVRVMGNVRAGEAAQALRDLRAELATRDENAERYLWLRANWDRVATRVECDNAATRVVRIELLDRRSYLPLDAGSLDAALDKARKGEGEE